MRVLILEDEPIIALDIEDAVLRQTDAEICFASCLSEARPFVETGVDFAVLDINLGGRNETSIPIARELLARKIPFCFVSSAVEELPLHFAAVPKITKPFAHHQIMAAMPAYLQ